MYTKDKLVLPVFPQENQILSHQAFKWHERAIRELTVAGEPAGSVEACTDNKGAYDLCHRFTSAQHSRHVDRKLFKMRELRGAGTVVVKHIPTEVNPADMFTKVLTRQVFERHARFVMNWAADERPPDERIAQDKTEIKKT